MLFVCDLFPCQIKNLSILSIDQTEEMGYTYGMKVLSSTAAKAKGIQSLLMGADEGNRLARLAGCE